jgi:hypothetical protein
VEAAVFLALVLWPTEKKIRRIRLYNLLTIFQSAAKNTLNRIYISLLQTHTMVHVASNGDIP